MVTEQSTVYLNSEEAIAPVILFLKKEIITYTKYLYGCNKSQPETPISCISYNSNLFNYEEPIFSSGKWLPENHISMTH